MNQLMTFPDKSCFKGLAEGFFAPISGNLIDQLISEYEGQKKSVKDFYDAFHDKKYSRAITYFFETVSDKGRIPISTNIFNNLEEAIKVLDAEFWQKALNATDIYQYMPNDRRQEWRKAIDERDVPSFEPTTVYETLKDLMYNRDRFLAERVDSLFRALSGEHVTNTPEGFNKRMIMYVATDYGGYISTDSSRVGYINDLRLLIAKFMNRDMDARFNHTIDFVDRLFKNGDTGIWHDVDGGAFRIKVFKKGTAHLEIHPDLAWRFNEILALLHPQAIPAKFRKKPEKRLKKFSLTQNFIPSDVLKVLGNVEHGYTYREWAGRMEINGRDTSTYQFMRSHHVDSHLKEKAAQVMMACGGERIRDDLFKFDYDFMPILNELLRLGQIPDVVAHQYYPTPTDLAQQIVDWCDIEESHECLEPSAGQGNIAALMPSHTVCVEVSELHCKILESKGLKAVKADFIEWAETQTMRYDRICANPPFSKGRAEAHINAAAKLLEMDGVLTAIVPSGIKNKTQLPGFDYEWIKLDSTEFKGVNVNVVGIKMTRTAFI